MNKKKVDIFFEEDYEIPEAKLVFSSHAWEKLTYMKKKATTEISGFGVTDPENPLYIEDFEIITQKCTAVSTEFDDKARMKFQEDMIEQGLMPVNFLRVWIHTHPGMGASPSSTDEETFYRVLGGCDWAVMFILGENNKYTCTLQYNKFPVGRFSIPMKVEDAVVEEWDQELKEKVTKESHIYTLSKNQKIGTGRAVGSQNGRNNVIFPQCLDHIDDFYCPIGDCSDCETYDCCEGEYDE